jgi:peptide/nickel transport system substrate-binding protein
LIRRIGAAATLLSIPSLAAACAPAAPTASSTQAPAPAAGATVAAPTTAPAKPTSAPARTDLRIGQFAEPANLDPFLTTNVEQGEVQNSIFTPLVALDYKTLQPAPALATQWSQPDPLTWRFNLRQGVQFHKGYGELTADDVAFNVNYTIQQNKPRKFLYFFVDGATAADKYTVDIKLSKPFVPFLVTAAAGQGTWIVSQKAYNDIGADAFGRNPVGSGPFEFQSWDSGSAITLTRFANYWDTGKPKLDRLIYHPVVDTNVKKLQLVNGELDFIDQPDFKDIPELKGNSNLALATSPGWAWNAITFNMNLPSDHPLSKKPVRQAIAYAIDRQEIANGAYFGNAIPDDDPLPPGYLTTDKGVHLYGTTANLDKAKQLLADAGYASGFSVSAIVDSKTAMRRQLEIIANELSKVGIQVKIEQLESTEFQRMQDGQFEMGMFDITVMTPDPDSALYWFQHSKTIGNFGYHNQTVDDLLDQARQESDQQKRAQMYSDVLTTVLDDAAYIFTVHRGMVWAYNSAITGFQARPQDYLLDFQDVHW